MEKLTIKQIHQDLVNKKISCQDLIKQYLSEIEKFDGEIRALLEVFKEEALAEAKLVDEKIKKGEALKSLDGIPVIIKDNLLYAGHHCSAGSKVLENYVAPYTATAVQKLKEAGAIILGRSNMDEFAMGSSTENSAYGVTKNPYDLERVPGGSSGGSAAAVAANFCVASLGSDTGGSIRQPAAFCGVVGLKPTYGAVSRYGLMAMSSSLDQVGPMANTLADTREIFEAIMGQDEKDATSKELPTLREKTLKGLKIGLPKEYFAKGLDPQIEKNILQTIEKLKQAGAKIKSVSLPSAEYALAAYYLIMPAEVSSNLARFDGMRYGLSLKDQAANLIDVYKNSRAQGFGSEAKRRIILGTFSLSSGYFDAYYKKALQVQELIKQDFEKVFQEVDCLITPTTPTVAFKIGEKNNDPLQMYLSDIYTVSVNLAGLPALSLPNGLVDKMPVGLQIIGPHFTEHFLFSVGEQIEKINK
ncbi:MAG TPA: Asp-tRNA(Asn)/Glu-tRNA(Gln) amidotransferase subunit GatA [Candidatus Magasanikbacteria bacterium]|nr:Asp-tRNA(Asn)/Glu-tRNA(Gln) amidotransferase subunit GatA [Candidatus Magasanikbacteria bacterium]